MIYDNPRSGSFIDLCPRSLRFNIFKLVFPKKKTRLFEAKFHIQPPWDDGMKICSNVPGYMTKMACRPIYGKNLQNQEADDLETCYTASGTQICSSDTGLTLTIFMTWSYLFPNVSTWVKAYTAYSHVFPSLF